MRIIWALYRTWGRVRPVTRASSTVSGMVAMRSSSAITAPTLDIVYAASLRHRQLNSAPPPVCCLHHSRRPMPLR